MHEDDVRWFQEQLKALQRRQRREWTSPDGLTQTAVRVIGSVARSAEGTQPGLVAADLGLTSSNVAAALRELESRGLVVRSKDAQDTRRTNLRLTATGSALVASSRDARDGWLSRAVDAVLDADEQAVLLEAGRLLERLSRFDGETGATGASGSSDAVGS